MPYFADFFYIFSLLSNHHRIFLIVSAFIMNSINHCTLPRHLVCCSLFLWPFRRQEYLQCDWRIFNFIVAHYKQKWWRWWKMAVRSWLSLFSIFILSLWPLLSRMFLLPLLLKISFLSFLDNHSAKCHKKLKMMAKRMY